VNPASARALVPPQPNLGPEPWSEPQSISRVLLAVVLLVCLLCCWLAWRRLGRRRAQHVRHDLSNQGPPDATPRGRLVAHSDSIRDVLAKQFGPAWRAKTTEELSAEVRLEEVLGHDQLQELIRFLDEIDQLKFAPKRSNHHHESLERTLTTWEPRLADLKRKIQARPEIRVRNASVDSGVKKSRRRLDPAEAARSR
jgi:hypothetical protein